MQATCDNIRRLRPLLGTFVEVAAAGHGAAKMEAARGDAVLIVTAFGLYYAASESLGAWASDLHIAFGLVIPLLFLTHIKIERKPSTPRVPRSGLARRAPPRS